MRYFSIFIEQTSRYILDYVRPMDRCRISLRPAIKFGPFRRENIRTNSQDAACDRPPEPTYLTYFTTYKLFFPLLCPALVARIAFSRRTVRSRGTIRACVYRSGWKKPRDQFARVPRGASKPEGKGERASSFRVTRIENARRSFPTYYHRSERILNCIELAKRKLLGKNSRKAVKSEEKSDGRSCVSSSSSSSCHFEAFIRWSDWWYGSVPIEKNVKIDRSGERKAD